MYIYWYLHLNELKGLIYWGKIKINAQGYTYIQMHIHAHIHRHTHVFVVSVFVCACVYFTFHFVFYGVSALCPVKQFWRVSANMSYESDKSSMMIWPQKETQWNLIHILWSILCVCLSPSINVQFVIEIWNLVTKGFWPIESIDLIILAVWIILRKKKTIIVIGIFERK